MSYTVILKDRKTGIITDISFENKQSFDNWYDDSIKKTDELIAENIDESQLSKYTKSAESVQAAINLITTAKMNFN